MGECESESSPLPYRAGSRSLRGRMRDTMKANPFARSATIATLTVYALAEGRQCVGEVTGTGRFTSHGAYPRGVDPEQPEQPELLVTRLTKPGDRRPKRASGPI
jgi:hypothetical protein